MLLAYSILQQVKISLLNILTLLLL